MAEVPQLGTVASWNEERGMGFIKPLDGTPDRFVHRSALADGQALRVGATVTFTPGFDTAKNKPIVKACSGAVPNGLGVNGQPNFVEALLHTTIATTEPGLQSGTVKTWLEDRGMGFITPATGGEDVFVHRSFLADGQSLTIGSIVAYESAFDAVKNKPTAKNVRGAHAAKGAGKGESSADANVDAASASLAAQSALANAALGANANAGAFNLQSLIATQQILAAAGYGAAGYGPAAAPVANHLSPYGISPYGIAPATGYAPGAMPTMAPMAAASPPLPLGWGSAVDPATRQTYYFNHATRETSWTPPAALAPPAAPAPVPAAPLAPAFAGVPSMPTLALANEPAALPALATMPAMAPGSAETLFSMPSAFPQMQQAYAVPPQTLMPQAVQMPQMPQAAQLSQAPQMPPSMQTGWP